MTARDASSSRSKAAPQGSGRLAGKKAPARKPAKKQKKKQAAKPRAVRSKFYFDEEAADRVCDFFRLFLRHSKGEWSGSPFVLEPWQAHALREAFGWKRRSDGTRRYRTLYMKVPRKNGKSTLAAGLAAFLTLGDAEPGAEVYSCANKKEQAAIVFGEAARMVKASPELASMAEVLKAAVVVHDTFSAYRVLSSDAGGTDGLNPHGLVQDEFHELRDRPLWEKLTTGGASRRQPMTIVLTTAGVGRHTLYAELDAHARRVLEDPGLDESFLPIVYQADPTDDWHDPKVWAKANPNLGVSVKMDYLIEQHRRAVLMPAYENTFKRYHLNIDTEQETRWMNMEAWDACSGETAGDELRGRKCYIGLDLSRRVDVTAAVASFPDDSGGFDVLPIFFVPEEGLEAREKRDDFPYRRFVQQGLIVATPGNVIDYSFIRTHLLGWARIYQVEEVAYDPYGATQLALQLQDDGLTCVEFQQNWKWISEPTKALEALVLSRKLRHGGNPVLRWMVSNTAIEIDSQGNIKPSKRKSTGRIDGVPALVMAIGRATLTAKEPPSIYEKQGIRTL